MSRPGEVWLLRHAATEWSVSGRHTGSRSDVPLTAEGRDAAVRLREGLAKVPFEAVFASPMRRTVETATLAGLAEGMTLDADLREWDYGDLEGLTTPQIRERFAAWTIWDGPVPGGESAESVAARAHAVIGRIAAFEGRVAVVSHGHFSRVLTAIWLGLGPREGRCFTLDTGTISVLSWEHEHPTLRRWNGAAATPGVSR